MKGWRLLLAVVAATAVCWSLGCSNPNLAGGKLHFDQASRLEGADRTARFERALETFRRAVVELPQSGEARLWLGRTLAELDQPDSAAVWFARAEQTDPVLAKDIKDVRGHYYGEKYNAGLVAAKKAQTSKVAGDSEGSVAAYRDAMAQFRKATVYDPSNAGAYTMIGKVHLNLSSVDSALTMMKKAREMAPGDPKVQQDLFLIYRQEGDVAYEDAQMSLQAGDSTKAASLLREARRLYTEAEGISPGDPDVAFQAAATAYSLSEFERDGARKNEYLAEAVTRYEDVLKANPVDVDVLYNLALVLRDLQRFEEAKVYAQRLVDLKPRDGTYRETLGRIEDRLGNKQALVTGIVFGMALKNGQQVPVDQARSRAEKFGSAAEALRRYRENGPPEEILSFTDQQGQEYDIWFYWSRGQGFGFQQGKEKFSSSFAPDGVLKLNRHELATKGSDKVITGTLVNGSSRKYEHVRVQFALFNDADEKLGEAHITSNDIGPRADWSFEIPLNDEQSAATKVQPEAVLGY